MQNRVASFLLLISLATVPYLNALKGSFVYDDSAMVLENPNVVGRTTLGQLLFDKGVMPFSGEIYRPIRDISYRIDFLIGKKEPFTYHFTNIILHAFATLAAYWFMTLLFKDSNMPLLAAALFAVHPVHTESVAWVKGRDDILFTLFYFLSLAMYLLYEEGRKRGLLYLFSLFLFVLSLFSKEMAITLPIVIGLYQLIFKRFRPYRLLPFFVIAAIYMGLRSYVLGQVAQQGYWGGGFIPTVLTMTKGFAQYVRLSFLPINQCADYFSFPISTGIDPGVVYALLSLSFISVCLFTVHDKAILWGGTFFFATLLPVSNLIPIKIVIAERFLYLPIFGFCIVFASVLSAVLNNDRSFRVVGGIVVCFFILLAYQRNYVWSNEYSLWADTLKKAPGNPRAHYSIGSVLASKGMLEEAIGEYKKAVRLAPHNPDVFSGLGLAYYKKGMIDEATILFKNALKNDPDHRDARYNLALLYHEQGKIDEAIREYIVLLKLRPDDFEALNNLGLAFFQKGFFEKSLVLYQKMLDIDSKSVAPYNNIGMVYAVMGKRVEAEEWFKKGLIIEPESAETYFNLGYFYQNMGRLEEAAEAYKKALGIRPDYEEAKARLRKLNR